MPKFTFQLEGVLSLRKRAEQQAQRSLAERTAHAASLRAEIERLNNDLVSATNELRSGHLQGAVNVAYLTAHRRYTQSVAKRGGDLMTKLAHAEREVTKARQQLSEAAKQRKVLETLRDKQEARWRAELIRRELLEADDDAGRWADMISRDRSAAEAAAYLAGEDIEGVRR